MYTGTLLTMPLPHRGGGGGGMEPSSVGYAGCQEGAKAQLSPPLQGGRPVCLLEAAKPSLGWGR